MRTLRRLLKRLLLLLLFLLLLLLMVAVLALFTQPGLRATLDLAGQLVPGFGYEHLQGSLWRSLTLTGLHYRDGDLRLQVKQLRLDWKPDDLLARRLHIQRLELDGTRLRLPASKAAAQTTGPLSLPNVSLPFDVSIDALKIRDLQVQRIGSAKPTVLQELALRARTDQGRLQLESLDINADQAQLAVHGELTPRGTYPVRLQFDWQWHGLKYGPLKGSGDITGTLGKMLVVDQQLTGLVTAKLGARIRQPLTTPSWQATLQLHSDNLGLFNPRLKGSPLNAELHSQGSLQNFNLTAQLNSVVPDFGPLKATLDATGNTQQLHIRKLDLSAAQRPLQLTAQADIDLHQQTLAAHGQWRQLAWPLSGPARYASPQGQFRLSGTLKDYQLTLDAKLDGSQLGALAVSLRANGSRQMLHLTRLQLNEPGQKLDLSATGQVGLKDRRFQIDAHWQALRWPLTGTARVTSPQGQLTASGSPADYQADLQTRLGGPLLGTLAARARVQGNLKQVKLTRFEINEPAGKQPLKLQAHGEVSLGTLDFQARGDWQQLRWPLQGTPQYQSPSGSFDTSGNLQDYKFLLQASAAGQNVPDGKWRVEGTGSSNALKHLQLRGDTLNGTLTGELQARWKPALSWQARAQAKALDPGVKWPQFKGHLGFTLTSTGSRNNGVLTGNTRLTDLTGELAGKPVAGSADIQLTGSRITIAPLKLEAAGADLQAKGGLGQQLDLTWQLTIPDLHSLLPTGRGSIHASGQLAGTRKLPRANLELALNQVRLGNNRIDRLQGRVKLDLSGTSKSQIDIQGRGLAVAGQQWRQLRITGAGTPADNGLQAQLDGQRGRFDLALQGGVKGAVWHGRLTRLSVRQSVAGNWRLSQPAALQLSTSTAKLDQACIASAPSRVCLDGSWQKSGPAQGKVVLERLNLARFQSLLPAGTQLSNSLSGQISGRYSAAGKPDGKVTLKLSGGTLRVVEQGRPLTLNLGQSTLDGTLDAARARAELHLDLGQLGKVGSVISVTDPLSQGRLDGRLQAALQHFDIVSKLAPQLQDLKGRVNADLKLSGTYKAPVARGQVKLTGGAVTVPQAGVKIQDIQLEASGSGSDQLQFTGSAQSGQGTLKLSGRYRLGEQQLKLTITGDKFETLNTFSKVIISPDLQLAISPKAIQVSGEVKVPTANIAPPPSLASRVSPSSDVVIVRQANGKPPPKPLTRQLNAHLRVILGDQVWVTAGGFRGQLKGSLVIDQTPQLAPRASGSVEVVAGNYKVYGQTLDIERGRLLFSGGPVDNPGLDLLVSRNFDSGATTVGAQITGSLRQPKLRLFSTPAMANSSILSYLVFGHGPGDNSSNQNALLLQAAAALGASGGNFLTKGVAKDLGLDVQFTGGSTPQDSAVAIGRYLAPGLYVSYGIGLFDAVNKFTLRYKLGKHLSVESSSTGSSNSVDLLYTIQH